MYGQLKSTVTCQTCSNVSITFDPFLTLSLPIARPFKLEVTYLPYEICDDKGEEAKAYQLKLTLNKSSTISDLKQMIIEAMKNDVEAENLVIANFNNRSKQLDTIFKSSQSCQDID